MAMYLYSIVVQLFGNSTCVQVWGKNDFVPPSLFNRLLTLARAHANLLSLVIYLVCVYMHGSLLLMLLCILDEGGSGVGTFLSALGTDSVPERSQTSHDTTKDDHISLFRVSDINGTPEFTEISPATRTSLMSSDAYIVDSVTAVYAWVGRDASLSERRLVVQYAQKHLHDRRKAGEQINNKKSIIVMREGEESSDFDKILP
jgi:hypothetical protein